MARNEEREREGRNQGRTYERDADYGADAYEGREARSFQPRPGQERRPVSGERETGPSHAGPRSGAGGYTGYGGRSVDERGYGSRNYSTGRDDRDFSAVGGGYGSDVYQERDSGRGGRRYGGEDSRSRMDREAYGPRYDRAQDDHWTFGFGHDLGGRDDAPGRPRKEYEEDHGRRDGGGLWDRAQHFFGRDQDYERERESHRGRGPQGYRRSDARISEDVHDRLTEDPDLDASHISVAVKDGEVTLTGLVNSRWAKHHAERIVEDLSGVGHVQNNLRVEERSPSRGPTTNASAPLGENAKLSEQAAGKA